MTESTTAPVPIAEADVLRMMRPTILVTDKFGTILAAYGGSGKPLGYAIEDLVGHNGLEFVAEQDHQAMADMFLATEGTPNVAIPEPFPIHIVGPDGIARHWDCVPHGLTDGEEDGWIATLTCRSEQSVSIDAMEAFIEGGTSLEIAHLVASRYTSSTDPQWRKIAFVLHRSPGTHVAGSNPWQCFNPVPEAEPELFETLVEHVNDDIALWGEFQPGSTDGITNLPPALQAAATSTGLIRCTAVSAGLDDKPQLIILRFSDVGYALQANNLLADRAVHAVLQRSIIAERSRDVLDQAVRLDPLTGVANRLRFDEFILNAEDATNHGVLFIDIDQFKSVNDTFGHEVGDSALRAVADRIVRACRPQDLVARIGGDEFAVILRDVTASEVSRIAKRIRTSMDAPLSESLGPDAISVTVGVAAPSSEATLTELVRQADHAMLADKAASRAKSTPLRT